jgi:hypothetical protein
MFAFFFFLAYSIEFQLHLAVGQFSITFASRIEAYAAYEKFMKDRMPLPPGLQLQSPEPVSKKSCNKIGLEWR